MNEGIVRDPVYAFRVIGLVLVLFVAISIAILGFLIMILYVTSWVEFLTGLVFFVTGIAICYYLGNMLLEL